MRTAVLLIMAAGLAPAAGQIADAVRAEKDKLKGTWTLEAVRAGGIDEKDLKEDQWKMWKGLRLTFGDDRVVIESAAEPKGVTEPYKLDATKKPKELDIGRGPARREYIYKLDGERLIVAFPFFLDLVAGGTFEERQRQIRRPRDFKRTNDNAPPVIWILKRMVLPKTTDNDPAQPIDKRLADLIRRMTLEEKAECLFHNSKDHAPRWQPRGRT